MWFPVFRRRKGTLMKKLVTDYENYALSVSMTTRQPRTGEVDGRDYFFVTDEEFETGSQMTE